MLIPDKLLDAAEELADAAEMFLEAEWELALDLEDCDSDEDSFAPVFKKDAYQTLARSLRDFRKAEMRRLCARAVAISS
jgi:hypothetical protein